MTVTIEKQKTLAEAFVERFFPPAFFQKQTVMDKIFTCYSLSDFEKINTTANKDVLVEIFKAAEFSDQGAKSLTKTRLTQIFANLKPVRGQSTFI